MCRSKSGALKQIHADKSSLHTPLSPGIASEWKSGLCLSASSSRLPGAPAGDTRTCTQSPQLPGCHGTEPHMVGNADLVGAGCALRQAAGEGDARALEHLLRTSGYDPADLLMLTDGDGTTALMEAAMAGDHVDVMRLLLDHPCADAATILMHATHLGFTAVIAAAVSGHVDVMRLLLTHPSADPAAMMAFNADIGESALVAAAVFATGGIAGDADDYEDALPPSCAPLLFLLRRFAMQPQPCDAQEAHMSKVMEVLMAGPRSGALFDDDQPDDVRDECIRLLLEFGARGFDYNRPCVTRIVRDGLQMVQLLNEAVVGVALAQQQH